MLAPAEEWFEQIGANLDELEDILGFRMALEKQAAAFAAGRRTTEDVEALRNAVQQLRQPGLSRTDFRQADSLFHQAVGRASKNRRLEQAIRVSRGEMFLPTERLLYRYHVDITLKGHKAILAAIEAGDSEQASAAAEQHMNVARQEFYEAIQRTK
jgi:DNA-binding FadR family transcriptional regulator